MALFFQFILFAVLFVLIAVGITALMLYQKVKQLMGFGSFHKKTSSNGPTVIDRRTRQEAERKIFSRDEGEYVEFEEVDNTPA